MAAMRALLREALLAGAAGFSTGRTDNHRTSHGLETPASEASMAELTALAGAFEGLHHGVLQVVSDFDLLRGPGHFDAEFDLLEAMARASGRPLSMTWLQRDPGGEQWKAIRARVERGVQQGLSLWLQAATRGIGVILGLDASFHPFIGFPGYKEIAALPLPARAAAMREPARKALILSQRSERLSGEGTPIPPLVDLLLARIEQIAARMFALDENPAYEQPLAASFAARARQRGVSALEVLYDHLAEGVGDRLIYFPIFNYNNGTLDAVRDMLLHPRALVGLGDAGAHVGTICDASMSTFLLTHWVRERGEAGLALERAVHLLTARNAHHLGLSDRGVIAPGMRADLNLIDPSRLAVGVPRIVRDLPAGGRRFLQRGEGYVGTWVAGRCVQRGGEVTPERPGRLVRSRPAIG
jgi:N-acyl-D-aspartate/D-glutamate deacylase